MPPPLALALANIRAGIPAATNIGVAFAGGAAVPNFLDSAFDLIGDILDPFVPGGKGSELRPGAFGGDRAKQNRARAAAGLPPLSGGRRRRRKALTDSDMAQAAQISSMISKKAAENFILRRTRSG